MGQLLTSLSALFFSAITSITTFFSSPVIPQATPTPIVKTVSTYKAVGRYEYSGYSSEITLQFPVDGGLLEGNITGDCDGLLNGSYDSNWKSIAGKGEGNCKILLLNVKAQLGFNGVVKENHVLMNFAGTSNGFRHEDSVKLELTKSP